MDTQTPLALPTPSAHACRVPHARFAAMRRADGSAAKGCGFPGVITCNFCAEWAQREAACRAVAGQRDTGVVLSRQAIGACSAQALGSHPHPIAVPSLESVCFP